MSEDGVLKHDNRGRWFEKTVDSLSIYMQLADPEYLSSTTKETTQRSAPA
jgi:hypothetical protein